MLIRDIFIDNIKLSQEAVEDIYVTKTVTKNNWVQENGKWKYVDENGAAVSNTWKQVNGKWYYLKSNGAMAKNEYINGYWLSENGAWK